MESLKCKHDYLSLVPHTWPVPRDHEREFPMLLEVPSLDPHSPTINHARTNGDGDE
jgi:hypothetical protein